MDLNILARTLAEKWRRCCGSDDLCQRLERDIREAIEKTLEAADEAVGNALYDDRGAMDLRDAQALKDALRAIRSLKQSNSGMEATVTPKTL